MSGHSLAFRVMRLCRPSFEVDLPLRVDPVDLMLGEDFFENDESSMDFSNTFSAKKEEQEGFWRRFEVESPSDTFGLSGLLVLPQTFGSIYLGETFCSYVSVGNHTEFDVRDIAIKAEIQTERQRIVLADNSKSPIDAIARGGRYDFIIEHDIKDLGPHTLVCMAAYTDYEGERKYLPQYFKFVVSNPLSVRTKVRTAKNTTFLEACIENLTKSHLFMDEVRFEPVPPWTVVEIESGDDTFSCDFLSGLLKQSKLIRANGGVCNYLYELREPVLEAAFVNVEGSNTLGKLEITWRTMLGEPGRLQTQQILGSPIQHKEISLRVAELPSCVILERPFLLRINIANHTDRKIGPLQISLSQDETLGVQKTVLVNGLWSMIVPALEAFSTTDFNLSLVATAIGIQKVAGIGVFDARDGKPYDTLPVTEVFVETE